MNKMMRRKATGEGGVMIKILEALVEFRVSKVNSLANQVCNSMVITTQMCRLILIAMPKVSSGTLECDSRRTVSLIIVK